MTSTFVTVCANNYLPQAVRLSRSLRSLYGRGAHLILVERHHPQFELSKEFESVTTASQIMGEEFDSLVFSYSIVEACTFVKASAFRWFLTRSERLIYLDPDIVVYSKFEELVTTDHPIIATPHLLDAETTWRAIFENEVRVLRHGICNLGFLALQRVSECEDFLEWWDRRLRRLCFDDPARGYYVDQRWFDLALGLFPVHLLRHPGYNVANWNAVARKLQQKDGRLICGDKHDLRFFHFSGVLTDRDLRTYAMASSPHSERALLLREAYISDLNRLRAEIGLIGDWSYSKFLSGESVESRSRRNWAFRPSDAADGVNPFSLSNADLSYFGGP